MKFWVVIVFARIDITAFGSDTSTFIPGDPTAARLVQADSREHAIQIVGSAAGFYDAFELPDWMTPHQYRLVEVDS